MKKLICVGGISATGKTTVGYKILSCYKNSVLICPDEVRLEILGKSKGDVITNEDLSREITLQVIDVMYTKTKQSLDQGLTVIVPSSFIIEKMRNDFEQIAADHNAEFHGFWLEAPFDIIKKRALARARNGNKSSKTAFNNASAVVPSKTTAAEGVVHWQCIDANRRPKDVLEDILIQMKAPLRKVLQKASHSAGLLKK